MYPYSDGVGDIISPVSNSALDLSKIKTENTIYTIFGLPSTGKGTLARSLAKKLNLPHFDTGTLYRALTYFHIKNNLKLSDDSLKQFSLQVKLESNGSEIKVYLNHKLLLDTDYRVPEIDLQMGNFTKIPAARAEIDNLIANFVLKTSFVTDGRGAYDGYLMQAEKLGFKIVRILLQANQEERIRRRFIDYLNLKRGTEIDSKVVENLWKTCVETVKYRDLEEIEKEKILNLGLVSPDTGILDTSYLSIEESLDAVLGWIFDLNS